MVAGQCLHFGVQKGSDIGDKGGLRVKPQMHAEIIKNLLRIMRIALHIGLGELGPKSGGVDQGTCCYVVRMAVLPVRREQAPWSKLPDRDCQSLSGFRVRYQ